MRTGRWLYVAALLAAGVLGWTATAAEDKETFVPADVRLGRGSSFSFGVGGKTAAVYLFGDDLAKPIFWPLKCPNNVEITRPWPMRPLVKGGTNDHKHQKSAWFTYGDVIPEGMEIKHKRKGVEGIDFWAEETGCGCIVCVKSGELESRGNQASLNTTNEWRDADGVKIMDEERGIRFFGYEKARLIIVNIDLCASVVPITFGDTKEGAFGVRVADSIIERKGKGHITNAEGKVGMAECWGQISAWCDYSGPVENDTAGIAIFAGPNNPYPSCWHSRDYGLMAANPFGRAASGYPAVKDKKDKKDRVHLARGEHLKLRYGIYLHSGDVKSGKVAEGYELFKKLK